MSSFPMVIAHRGASAIAPENTLPAFRRANEMDCDGIELDVHPSRDGYVVVIHDETLDRTTNGTGLVSNHTLAQLKALDASKLFPNKFPNTSLPTLEEVFKLVLNTKLKVIVELKGNYADLADKVVNLIYKYGFKKRVVISSYNHEYLKHIKTLYPDIQTEVDFFIVLDNIIKFARKLDVNVLCGDYKYVERMRRLTVKRIQLKGLKLFTYTVDSEEAMIKCINKGVNGIMTNRPDLLLKLKANYKPLGSRLINLIRH